MTEMHFVLELGAVTEKYNEVNIIGNFNTKK